MQVSRRLSQRERSWQTRQCSKSHTCYKQPWLREPRRVNFWTFQKVQKEEGSKTSFHSNAPKSVQGNEYLKVLAGDLVGTLGVYQIGCLAFRRKDKTELTRCIRILRYCLSLIGKRGIGGWSHLLGPTYIGFGRKSINFHIRKLLTFKNFLTEYSNWPWAWCYGGGRSKGLPTVMLHDTPHGGVHTAAGSEPVKVESVHESH